MTNPELAVVTVEWPAAKVELVHRAAKFAKSEDVAVTLACTDERCKSDPLLRRKDVEPGVFLLFCHHKIRICRDAHKVKKLARRLRRERPSKASAKRDRQLAELNIIDRAPIVPDEKPTTLIIDDPTTEEQRQQPLGDGGPIVRAILDVK